MQIPTSPNPAAGTGPPAPRGPTAEGQLKTWIIDAVRNAGLLPAYLIIKALFFAQEDPRKKTKTTFQPTHAQEEGEHFEFATTTDCTERHTCQSSRT